MKRAWVAPLLEAAVSVLFAGMFLASCFLIRVYPVERIAQIAGLASLGGLRGLFGRS